MDDSLNTRLAASQALCNHLACSTANIKDSSSNMSSLMW
jgi:hypothetical protein